MNIRQILSIFFMHLILFSCFADDKNESPYVQALRTIGNDKSIFMQIIYSGNYKKFENTEIDLYGYFNEDDFRIYLSSDFNDPMLKDDEFKRSESIELYRKYDNKKLADLSFCKGGDNLIQVSGIFRVEKSTNNKVINYYMTDIENIYEFDKTPIHEGGRGEKFECYLELNEQFTDN